MAAAPSVRAKPLTAAVLGSDPIDEHIGRRVRLRRNIMGLSQMELGEAIGVTFQQVQKYERGTNRISGSRLFDIACVLRVPVGYFYDDVDEELVRARIERAKKAEAVGSRSYEPPEAALPATDAIDPMTKTENIELVRDLGKLSTDQQVSVRAFIKAMTRRD